MLSIRKPSEILREVFLARKARNSRYSTRAFARDIGMSQALLSLIFNEKRPLSFRQATQVAILLKFSKQQSQQLIESAIFALPTNSKALKKFRRMYIKSAQTRVTARPIILDIEVERFKAISQWYHLPILDLSTTRGFMSDPVWISRRLGISAIEARDAMERLISLGLAKVENGIFKKLDSNIYFATTRSEVAVRSFHNQMIAKAQEQLRKSDSTSFQARRISGLTIAIKKSRLEEIKTKISAFERMLSTFASSGDCDEVYQLNIQLFPLTQKGTLL